MPCPCDQRADGGWSCQVCGGGLALCAVCGGGEGALPTDCPGYTMEPVCAEAVYAGELDYLRLEGWVQRPSGLAAFCRRDAT